MINASSEYDLSPAPKRELRGPFRLVFSSREEPRMRVADSVGLSARQLAEAQDVVQRHTGEIRDTWIRHFAA